MVTLPSNLVPGRQTKIEAACRVALRMLAGGRGSTAALQFLLDVAARLYDLPAAIVGQGGMPSLTSNEHVLGERWLTFAGKLPPEDYWSTPIRTSRGVSWGELRVRTSGSEGVDTAGAIALQTIAHAAAEIMARSDDSQSG